MIDNTCRMTSKNLFPPDIRSFLVAVTSIAESNPFGHGRPALETEALQSRFPPEPLHAANRLEREQQTHALAGQLEDCIRGLAKDVLQQGAAIPHEEKILFRNAVWFLSYQSCREPLDQHIAACEADPGRDHPVGNGAYKSFRGGLENLLHISRGAGYRQDPLSMNEQDVADVFAFFFQLRRGYNGILKRIIGTAPSTSRLREAVWESIFTRRLLWSFQYLKDRMANFSTLILGKSGTGKDLAAEAIGTSQFIPFLPAEDRFAANFASLYRAVNLSALSPSLVESELFGHARGAFTGAASAQKGHLELCSQYGALFLDEIGELSQEIQVKLLRVLQSREFYPLGERSARRFAGRILSATNRDIPSLVAEGRMREDFLYRIGATIIRTPTLVQRLSEDPEEASVLLPHFLEKTLGHVDEEVLREIEGKICSLAESGYPWPGNVREFEQCVRTLLVASKYDPLMPPEAPKDTLAALFQRMESAEATLDEVLAAYAGHVVGKMGTYQAASRRLQVDWRTVKKYAKGPSSVVP
jgi:transcriptional regulator with AAA-type ATPase domain